MQPPKEQIIYGCTVAWEESHDGSIGIFASGGNKNTRTSAKLAVQAQFEKIGFKRESSWTDIMAKAKRLIQSGNVQLARNGAQDIIGQVQGDHGNYQTSISRQDPNSRSITQWQCDCPWDQYAWQRCVILGTMITMANGTDKPVEDICVGDAVIDHLGQIGIVAETHVEDWDDDAVTFYTTGFEPLTVKPNHPVLGVEWASTRCVNKDGSFAKKGGVKDPHFGFCVLDHTNCRNPRSQTVNPKFRLAEEFGKGDYLVRPTLQSVIERERLDLRDLVSSQVIVEDGRIIPTREITTRWGVATIAKQRKASLPLDIAIDADLMRLIGYYIAEGGIANYSVRFSFHRQEVEYLDDVASLAKSIFDNDAKYEGKTENCLNVVMNNREIAHIFRSLIGTGHTTKSLPDWIMHLSPKLQAHLIEGWHRGDGHIRESDGRMELTTVSPQLAHQAEILLQRQGYTVGQIIERRSERQDTNEQDAHKLYWHVDKRHNRGVRFTEDGNTMVKVEKIERSNYQGKMIDLTIIGNPGYLANGFSVHNTRKWKKYEGRPCAHVLATYWKSLGTPLDEDVHPSQGEQQSLFTPPAAQPQGQNPSPFSAPVPPSQGMQMTLPGMIPGQAIGTPPGPSGAPVAPAPPSVLPQFPMDPALQQQVNPASVPGLRQPSPTNPTQYPGGTFSAVANDWEFDTMVRMGADLVNGQMVSTKYEDWGQFIGRSDEHGNGQPAKIPANSIGEVLGTDPTTGLVNILFENKMTEDMGELEPNGVTAWFLPSEVTYRPDVRAPGPAVRRR